MPIELKNITKAYGEKTVLGGISAVIPDRGIFGIFGDSGKGKTTLVRIICGLESPDDGEISGLEKLKPSVVFQEDRLLPWLTALENVAVASNREEALKWLERVDLENDIDKKPAQLSGGMKRRVAIARAFAYDADFLILDEPFKGLEPELKKKIGALISEYAQNCPVIIVTHDEYGISLAENSININNF